MSKLTSDLVEQAAEYIQQGWCKNVIQNEFGSVCAVGAVNKALYNGAVRYFDHCSEVDKEDLCEYTELLGEFATLLLGASQGSAIPRWNDDAERTHDEVIDAFTAAAKKLRDEGR